MGGMSGGTLVDPEYRGRGIFKVIRKHEDNKAKTIGIAVLLGFPNKISTNNFVCSGYKIHQSANVVYKPLGILNRENIKNVRVFINRFIENTIKKGIKKAEQAYKSDQTAREEIRVEMIKTFGSETEKLWNWVRKEHYVGIVKDSEYLNWRYYRRPNTDIIAVMGFKKNEPKALCIIEKDRMSRKPVRGFVSELLARNEDEDAAFVALIRGEDEARKNGMVGIWALSDGGSVISSLAMRNGYYTESVRPFIVNILDKNMENLFVSPWNLSMGDYYAGRGLRNQ
jgi:hypothetical protein